MRALPSEWCEWSEGSVLLKLIHPVRLSGGEQGALLPSKGSSGGVATGLALLCRKTVQNTLAGGVGSEEHLV